MKRYIKGTTYTGYDIPEENVIRITLNLYPLIYRDSNEEIVKVSAAVTFDGKRYHTDVNPDRRMNGPLSDVDQVLSSDLEQELKSFYDDCEFLIETRGFKILDRYRSNESKKSEYFFIFGMNDDPCGVLIFDVRISDHGLDAIVPEEKKKEIYDKLRLDKIIDEHITPENINFKVESVLIGNVEDDSWDRAFYRVDLKLKQLRNRIRVKLNEMRSRK